MKDFLIGVNYWASHAGTDMWKKWREDIVENDLEILAEHGIEVLRVFPNWHDFQPVEPDFTGMHKFREYRMAGNGYPENSYYLDELMLERFSRFCKIAQAKGLKLIVGLLTGWMSGKLFIPSALYDKNIFTDPVALYFQQLFVKGFVSSLKGEESIYAWDLGNECNCMDEINIREEAYNWSLMVTNAIRSCDQTRPVISGMHSLEIEGIWNIQDQGEVTDILVTHPYPFWVEHCQLAPLNEFRTLLHATAQTQYYAAIGRKPCLVEEIGSMGPMISSEEMAADFLKVNLWSNWANGSPGLLWWCAHDQSLLTEPPYDWNMCERELGMTDSQLQPKPTLLQMKAFRREMEELQLTLPYRMTDAVCILSKEQDHWGIAYMSYILAKQSGLTMDFVYCEQELPDSHVYFLPSVRRSVMNKKHYDILKKKIYGGATLYISMNDGFLTEFEELTGLQVVRSHRAGISGCVCWKGARIPYRKQYQLELISTRSAVLLMDEKDNPLFSVAQYGAGKVYFLNFPLEEMLLNEEKGFEEEYYKFYQFVAEDILQKQGIRKNNPFVGITIHKGAEADYAVLINYTSKVQKTEIQINDNYTKVTELYGTKDRIEPFGTAVISCEK